MHRLIRSLVFLAGALAIVGCSSGMPGGTSTPQTSVSIVGPASTRLLSTAQFTATVTNSPSQAVTWQVNGVAGGAAATGTISAAGLYTAPAVLPAQTQVTISAISVATPSASGSVVENIWNPMPVAGTVTATQVGPGSTYLIDATGSGFVPTSSIQVGGSNVTTTFVSAGDLQATVAIPAGTTSVSVDISTPDPGAAISAAVSVQITPITVSVSGPASTRLLSTAQFAATVANTSNQNVNWLVNGVIGGNSTTGTISISGLYQAPAVLLAAGAVTISATSQVVSTAAGSMSESLLNPLPVVSSALGTQVGASQNYLLDVVGSGFVPASAIQVGGASVSTVYVSATELQATIPVTAGTTTVAVDVANPNPGAATSGVYTARIGTVLASLTAAARLLDQTTFGPTASDIQHVQQVGIGAYITEQFAQPTTLLAAIPSSPLPAACLASNTPYPCAESEWWTAAIRGNDQLRQRVAFALSEMFVVSTQSITGQAVPQFHNALANDAFTNFSTLLKDVTLSPAMGAYLNMINSAKPGNGQIANENYARELMQLFSTGLYQLNQDGTVQTDSSGNPIPAYTQAQVQAFARAFTGWTFSVPGGGAPTRFPATVVNYNDPMGPFDAQHDTTAKVLLNGTTLPAGQTTLQDLNGALANIFNSPNVGPFVCKQLIQHLVTSTPSPAYVSRVAGVFADNGSGVRGDMKAVIRAILTDTEARAGDTNAAFDGGHLREPILFLTAMVRGLGFINTDVNGSYFSLSGQSSRLNQEPYRANSVFNFFPPSYIIPGSTTNAPEFGIENTASAVLRLTLADAIVNNKIAGFTVDLSNTSALGMTAANPANLVDTLSMLFLHSQMPASMRTTIINAITPLTSNAQRVRVATYLVITSSQYKVIH